MGHTRLGSVPKSRKWLAVIANVANGGSKSTALRDKDDVANIALQTLDAAQAALDRAIGDLGFQYTFYLLTQIVLAARQSEWQAELKDIGINIPEDAALFDLTAGVQDAIDDYIFAHGRHTDISEIAQQAAGEALSSLAGTRTGTLFDNRSDELKAAIRELSTKKGFAALGQKFFGRFISHFLNFYLSRITAGQVGGKNFQQIGDVSEFNEVLQTHCEQTAWIVRDFCGEWYSKTEFQEGINLDNASRFVAVALKKLRDELNQQRKEL